MIGWFLDWRHNRRIDRFQQSIECMAGNHRVLGSGICRSCKRDLIYDSPKARREWEAFYRAHI